MAKKKGARIKVGLVCEVCGRQNYVTEKNRMTTKEPLRLRKFCKNCRKYTYHKERKKLH